MIRNLERCDNKTFHLYLIPFNLLDPRNFLLHCYLDCLLFVMKFDMFS